MFLIIDGDEVPEIQEYTIAFYVKDEVITPSLYHKGKRVTKQWSISLIHSEPKDENGASA